MGRVVCALLAAALVVGTMASTASAGGGWPWPLGSSVSLPFGASWVDADGSTCAHRGVDIAGGAGSGVRACAAGTVAFCGRVPSSAGGTVLALSVQTSDGLRVTYMPLERASADTGARIAAGDPLGVLAAAGDGSSPEPHLHLSVRRGELPIDPALLLASPAAGEPCAPAMGAAPPADAPPAHTGVGEAAVPAPGIAPPAVTAVAVEPAADAPRILVPVPTGNGRALDTLPGGAGLRLPEISLRAPAVAVPDTALVTRVGAGLVSALALWMLVGHGRVPVRVRAGRGAR